MSQLHDKKTIMDADGIDRSIGRMAAEIVERNQSLSDAVVIGVQRRGVYLACRLCDKLRRLVGRRLPLGELDIALYRDDITLLDDQPVVNSTSIPTDINGKTVILVDDVIFTGRTVRAAMEALADMGRPSCVQLLVLIDRGHRELPIQPDYLGREVPTSLGEAVEVRVSELDGVDEVVIAESEKQ